MFRKYNSIENTYQQAFIEKIKEQGFDQQEFVVQEKAHGANISFYTTNGQDFQICKRTGIIELDENFYNYKELVIKIQPLLKALWIDLKQNIPDLIQLTVFGELIGGDYAHPDVARDKTAIKVQKGIFYSPSNEFYAFDLLINNDYYLTVDQIETYLEKHQFLYAKALFRGSFEACLKFPNDVESSIYQQLGLAKIEPNVVEGVVIRPNKPCFFDNGARIIIKNKNEKWSEKAKVRKRQVVKEVLSNQVINLQEEIMAYVTENRMNNVVSKIGEITPKDMGKVLGLFAADVLEDFIKDFGQQMNELEKKDQKLVSKVINKRAVELIKCVM